MKLFSAHPLHLSLVVNENFASTAHASARVPVHMIFVFVYVSAWDTDLLEIEINITQVREKASILL